MISVKSVCLAGLLVLSGLAATAQTYWSPDPALACGAYGDQNGNPIQLTTDPGAGNYVCQVVGTLPWYAAGREWGSSIRMAAPPTAPVNVSLYFADLNGQDTYLDFRYQGDSTVYNDTSAGATLYANQPMEVDLLGLHSEAPGYLTTSANGEVVVYADCPDAATCSQLQVQLIYSALPSYPWALSAPVVWDSQTWTAWSSVGIDDGKQGGDTVSFAVYNLADDGLPHAYTLNIYDSTGTLFSSAQTPVVPYEASYAAGVRQVSGLNVPAGTFKLQLVAGAAQYVAFEALQFHGTSATALVTAWENAVPLATPGATATSLHPAQVRRRVPPSSMTH